MANSPFARGDVTLDQLAALNDEIAALARAGIPLSRGLSDLGGDMPGRIGEIATTIGEQIEQGQPLLEALQSQNVPAAYRAVVAAGLRSGRLAVALEDVSSVIRRITESRRMVAAALIYPLILLGVAYVLFLFLLFSVFPVLLESYDTLVPGDRGLAFVRWLSETMTYWAPWVPLMVIGMCLAWWYYSRRAWRLQARFSVARWRKRAMRRPSAASMLYAGRMATFGETLALLIEHDVPLADAVGLAADASGDPGLRQSQDVLAERLRDGTSDFNRLTSLIPAGLAWLIASGCDRSTLVRSLRRISRSYRHRAEWMSRWLSVSLPIWLTIGIGGTTVLIYTVLVIAPWSRVLYQLGQP